MSEENKQGSAQPEQVSEPVKEENNFVPKKAYEDVSTDMHKFKAKVKEEQARANALEAQLKVIEESKLQEENRWKELYEKREAELNQVQSQVKAERQRNDRNRKMFALKQELGGSINDAYLVHANLDSITLEENGIVNADSLHEVANQFRKEHGQLIPSQQPANITGHAPSSTIDSEPEVLDISKVPSKERPAYYAKLLAKQNKQ